MGAFEQEYRTACGAMSVEPREPVLYAPAMELSCRGTIPALANARLTDKDVPPLVAALLADHAFEKVDLSYNELTTSSAEALTSLLQSDRLIQSLDLSANHLDTAAVVMLVGGLKSNTTLRELRLSGNPIGGHGGMLLAELLQTHPSLETVALSNTELTTESVVALATVLQGNDKVSTLDLDRALVHPIGEEASSHLSRMLKVNTTLTDLDLSRVGMRDFGLQLIAEELARAGHSALRALRLRANQLEVSEPGCVHALRALFGSKTCRINTLMLGSNRLKDDGALKLAEILSDNTSLLQLDLTSNGMTSRGLCAIGRAVDGHSTMQQIGLWGNRFDSAACVVWEPLLKVMLDIDFSVQLVDNTYIAVQN